MANARDIFDDEVHDMIMIADKAAYVVTKDYAQTHGELNFCGFAWVKIPPGQRKLVESFKRLGVGDRGYPSGWQFICHFHGTQCMRTLEEYAQVFAYVIREWEFTDGFKAKAWMESRVY